MFVEDGGIRFDIGGKFLDMNKGDSCLADAGDVQCFSNGVDFDNTDVYLTVKVEDLSDFDLFEDAQISVGGEICEID